MINIDVICFKTKFYYKNQQQQQQKLITENKFRLCGGCIIVIKLGFKLSLERHGFNGSLNLIVSGGSRHFINSHGFVNINNLSFIYAHKFDIIDTNRLWLSFSVLLFANRVLYLRYLRFMYFRRRFFNRLSVRFRWDQDFRCWLSFLLVFGTLFDFFNAWLYRFSLSNSSLNMC